MNIAYVITAYKYPQQLVRLIRSLQSKHAAFFVHIDKKVDIAPFVDSLNHYAVKITWLERENSRWGSVGCVKAVLNGINKVLASSEQYDYLYFLSGQDYPIKKRSFIEDYLYNNKEKSYIHYGKLPTEF